MSATRVGVLALQGDFAAHAAAIAAAGGEPHLIRTPEAVAKVEALVLPGGESTTIGKLLIRYGLDTAIRAAAADGMPIFATCAGMILLAREIASGGMRGGQPTLGLMDIAVARNAFGRQADSFEADLSVPAVSTESPLRAVFIRAPVVTAVGEGVAVLAEIANQPVLVRQGTLLAAAFHPELTDDSRLHRYFLGFVAEAEGPS